MAHYDGGILGSFSGKVGGVVGSKWKGRDIMKKRPPRRRKKKGTERQELAKARFQFARKFLRPFMSLITRTYIVGKEQSVGSVAVGNLIVEAILGDYPNLAIDYSMVQVSRGLLKAASNPNVSSSDTGKLTFTWVDNASTTEANSTDKAILVAYDSLNSDVIYSIEGNERSESGSTLEVPYFSGKLVHTWIGFLRKDGLSASDSIYLGTVTVL